MFNTLYVPLTEWILIHAYTLSLTQITSNIYHRYTDFNKQQDERKINEIDNADEKVHDTDDPDDPGKGGEPDVDVEQHSEPLKDNQINRDADGKSLWGCRSGYTRPIFGHPNKYQICYHGQWWTMTCPSNALYDADLQVCVVNYGGELS